MKLHKVKRKSNPQVEMIVENKIIILHTLKLHILYVNNISMSWKQIIVELLRKDGQARLV